MAQDFPTEFNQKLLNTQISQQRFTDFNIFQFWQKKLTFQTRKYCRIMHGTNKFCKICRTKTTIKIKTQINLNVPKTRNFHKALNTFHTNMNNKTVDFNYINQQV